VLRLVDFATPIYISSLKSQSRHCEELLRRSNPASFFTAAVWIAARSLSSGTHSSDPSARNDVLGAVRNISGHHRWEPSTRPRLKKSPRSPILVSVPPHSVRLPPRERYLGDRK
jgi:hypothetical protein